MADSLALLRIAADLHVAARSPERWSQAWEAVCAFFSCPEVIGAGMPAELPAKERIGHVADRATRARACVEARRGACSQPGNDSRCHYCSEFLPHLETALQGARDPRLAVLDSLPFPIFVCDRRLLYANAAGHGELERQDWLRLDGEMLAGANSAIERRLVAALAETTGQEQRVPLLQAGMAATDIICQRIENDAAGEQWVLRLLIHADAASASMDHLAEALGLTPRQVELAQLLLAGHTLTDAAKRLGIVRGSANNLLKYLFKATGTRRQAELVGYLSRRLNQDKG